jgi:regulator of sigma E protease
MGEDDEKDEPDSFRKKPIPVRIAVLAAGAVLNILIGFAIAMTAAASSGTVVNTTISVLDEDSAAARSGLQVGDAIYRINGRRIFTAGDISYQLSNAEGGAARITVVRDGERFDLGDVRFDMETDPETGRQVLKYGFKVTLVRDPGIGGVAVYAVKETIYSGRIVLMSLADMVRGKYGINDLSGPVGIVAIISDAAGERGFDWGFLFDISALISINVGIFNLLPLPALDGGRITLILLEGIRRKQMNAATEGTIHLVGFALLMLLMVVVTFNDIKNLFR